MSIPTDILANLILSGTPPGLGSGLPASAPEDNSAFADALATLLGGQPQTDGFAFLTDSEEQSGPLSVEITDITESEDGTDVSINIAPLIAAASSSQQPEITITPDDEQSLTSATPVDETAVGVSDPDVVAGDQPARPEHKIVVTQPIPTEPESGVAPGEQPDLPTIKTDNPVEITEPVDAAETIAGKSVPLTDETIVAALHKEEQSDAVVPTKKVDPNIAEEPVEPAQPKAQMQIDNEQIVVQSREPQDADQTVEVVKTGDQVAATSDKQQLPEAESDAATSAAKTEAPTTQQLPEQNEAKSTDTKHNVVSSRPAQTETSKIEPLDSNHPDVKVDKNTRLNAESAKSADQSATQPVSDLALAAKDAEVEVSPASTEVSHEHVKKAESPARSVGNTTPKAMHDDSKAAPGPTADSSGPQASAKTPALSDMKTSSHDTLTTKINEVDIQVSQNVTTTASTGSENSNQQQSTTIQSLAQAGASPDKSAAPEPTHIRQFIIETPKPIQVPGQVRVRIDPPQLGHIRVDLSASSQGIVGTMRIHSDQTRDAIERNIGDLQKSLADAGVRVERLEVVSMSRNDGRQSFNPNTPNQQDGGNPWLRYQSQSQSGSSQHGYSDTQENQGYRSHLATEDPQTSNTNRVAMGRLDLVA